MPALRRLAAVAAVLTLGACSSGTSTPRDALLEEAVPASVTVQARTIAGLGTVLVDGQGRTLYMFPPDAGGRVGCTGACVGVWPTLAVRDGSTPKAGRGVLADDLSTLPDPNTGARVVTYAGYPLYRYSGDLAAGEANGQALFNNGGPWYVLSPAGDPITKAFGT